MLVIIRVRLICAHVLLRFVGQAKRVLVVLEDSDDTSLEA